MNPVADAVAPENGNDPATEETGPVEPARGPATTLKAVADPGPVVVKLDPITEPRGMDIWFPEELRRGTYCKALAGNVVPPTTTIGEEETTPG